MFANYLTFAAASLVAFALADSLVGAPIATLATLAAGFGCFSFFFFLVYFSFPLIVTALVAELLDKE